MNCFLAARHVGIFKKLTIMIQLKKKTPIYYSLILLILLVSKVYSQSILRQSVLKEGEAIQKLVINNTEPTVIVTSWEQPSFEKAFVLGEIPIIKRFSAGYRIHSCWMSSTVGLQLSELPVETQFFLGDLGNNRYLMLIALVDDIFRSSLQGTKDNGLALILETGDEELQGTESASLYLSTGTDPYLMIAEASTHLAEYMKTFRLRKDKNIPWYVDYLGWHSWNAFYHKVSKKKIIKALKNFNNRELPIRWIMIDDGVQGQKDLKLNSYDADKRKFPNGLKEITSIAKNEYGIEKVFGWSLPWGYWWGIDTTVFKDYRKVDFIPPARYDNLKAAEDAGGRDEILKESTVGPEFYAQSFINKTFCIPGPTFGDFFYEYFKYLREQGMDGMKLDAMTWVETLGNNGNGGRIKWMRELLDGFQTAGDVQFNGELINCSSMSNDFFFNSLSANVTRSSIDFYPDIPKTHGKHVYVNAYNSFWIGHIVMPDWDMFQTGHPSGAFHAAARAISGGPIYISDEVGKENKETIKAMTTSRGELLRSLQYGQVCRDNLFTDIDKEKKAIKIFNINVCNSVVGTFNCSYDEQESIYASSQVKASDVEAIVGDRFAVFNFKTGKLSAVGGQESFEENLPPLDFNLYTFAPIANGFAPIGLSGKYNPGAAITNFNRIGKKEWVMELMDGGELVCYAEVKPLEVTLNGEPIDFNYEGKKLIISLPFQEDIVVKVGF